MECAMRKVEYVVNTLLAEKNRINYLFLPTFHISECFIVVQ